MTKRWVLLLLVAGGTACDEAATDLENEARVGALQVSGWTGFTTPAESRTDEGLLWNRPPAGADIVPPRVIDAPDTVDVGMPFHVTTYTVAPDGCWRGAGQDVRIQGRVLMLQPLDLHSGAAVCTMALSYPSHRSRVVLSERGRWGVIVMGRRIRPNGEVIDSLVTAEKTIIVR